MVLNVEVSTNEHIVIVPHGEGHCGSHCPITSGCDMFAMPSVFPQIGTGSAMMRAGVNEGSMRGGLVYVAGYVAGDILTQSIDESDVLRATEHMPDLPLIIMRLRGVRGYTT